MDELINADEELINNLLSFNSDFNNEILSGDIEDVVTEIINYNSTYLENSELSTTTEEFDYSSTEFSTTEDFSNEFAVTFASKPDEDYDEDDNDAEPPTIDVSSLTRLAEDDGLVSPNGLVRVVDLCSRKKCLYSNHTDVNVTVNQYIYMIFLNYNPYFSYFI